MGLIGPDGNDVLDIRPDGVTGYDYMSINGRAFTEWQREPFLPAFGVGLAQALSSPSLPEGVVQRRFQASFAGDPGYTGVQSIEVTVPGGNTYRIDLDLGLKTSSLD